MKHLNFSGRSGLFALILFALGLPQAFSQLPNVSINSQPVISGLTFPMQLVHAGDGSNRIFIAERRGVIKVFEREAMDTPIVYLNMNSPDSTVGAVGEGGLISIAFHPSYENNGFVYTFYTNLDGDLVVARYTAANPASNTISATTRQEVIRIPHPVNTNHNGGELHFGNDGNLYMSIGDGGGSNDPNSNAQNTASLLGKILRIDVNVAGGAATGNYAIPAGNPYANEVFAIGLRNPFRWSFDRATNDMWIGDVGQGAREEINHRPAAVTSNANYGWRCFEGDIPTPGIDRTGCGPAENYVSPVYTYATGALRGRSVIGGVVYRGTQWPSMQGIYIGTDYFSGDIHKISADGTLTGFQTSDLTGIVDIGEDEDGEIYAVGPNAVYMFFSEEGLPVRLAGFSGVGTPEGVRLNWTTTAEENFREFDIEFSRNALAFEKIGTVAGNNAGGSAYRFSHSTMDKGTLFYRLKMIDADNTFSYSRIVEVDRDGALSGLFVLPSLIENGVINVALNEPFQSLELISTSGKVLIRQEIAGKHGPLSLPVNDTPSGIYLVRLAGKDKSVQQKVLVVK